MTMGGRIRALRIQAGLSQEELGAAVGVQKAAIHKYESGLVQNLKQSTLHALAHALHTTPGYLLGLGGEEAAAAQREEALRLLGVLKEDGGVDMLRVEKIAQLINIAQSLS